MLNKSWSLIKTCKKLKSAFSVITATVYDSMTLISDRNHYMLSCFLIETYKLSFTNIVDNVVLSSPSYQGHSDYFTSATLLLNKKY